MTKTMTRKWKKKRCKSSKKIKNNWNLIATKLRGTIGMWTEILVISEVVSGNFYDSVLEFEN